MSELTEPDCYTCEHVEFIPQGSYCNKNHFVIESPYVDHDPQNLAAGCNGSYQEATSDE